MEEPIDETNSLSVVFLVAFAVVMVASVLVFLRLQTGSNDTSPVAASAVAPAATPVAGGETAVVPTASPVAPTATPKLDEAGSADPTAVAAAQEAFAKQLAECPQGEVPDGDGCVPLILGGFGSDKTEDTEPVSTPMPAATPGATNEGDDNAPSQDDDAAPNDESQAGLPPGSAEPTSSADTPDEVLPRGNADNTTEDNEGGDEETAEPEVPTDFRLEGVVRRADGAALGLATVYLANEGLTTELVGETNGSSAFLLDGPAGTYGFIIDAFSEDGSGGLVAETGPTSVAGVVSLDLVLAAQSSLVVTVLSAAGPVDGAEVTVVGPVTAETISGSVGAVPLVVLGPASTSNNGWFAFGATDSAGEANLSVYPGSNTVEVQFAGGEPQTFAWDGVSSTLMVTLS